MEVMLIARENIPYVLPHIEEGIQEVLSTFVLGDYTYPQVLQNLSQERAQLWIVASDETPIEGWMITEVQTIPGGKRLLLDLFGGKGMEDLLPFLEKIEAWAKELGVTESLAYSRPGLTRKLKAVGFHHVCDIVVRPLQEH